MKKDIPTPTLISIPNRRSKTREVSSRFLSQPESPLSSPSQTLSPIQQQQQQRKPRSSLDDQKKLWPSSSKRGTLADHLGNDRLNDLLDDRPAAPPPLLTRQRSCSEVDRFQKDNKSSKENHRPIFGGSMRYTRRKLMGLPRKPKSPSDSTSSKSSSSSFSNLVPPRLSVDANNFNYRRNSDSFADLLSSDDIGGGNGNAKNSSTYLASTASSRRLAAGVEVSSRYLNYDAASAKPRRASHSACSTPDNAPSSNILPPKNMMKRANSYKSTISQWALSPGRTGSPPMSVENKGKPTLSFSSFRPPHSPSRSKGVANLFSLGLDLFKSKKSPSSSSSASPVGHGHGVGENTHQLRMLHNRLIQWRYINAKAGIVNANRKTEAENSLLRAWSTISTLQAAVIQKRIQFRKEKLQFKLNKILQSQVRQLESWGDMERQHTASLSTTKDCLNSVICRVPLIEGAKADPQQISLPLRHAVDLTASIKATLTDFSSMARNECEYLTELCDVVTEEKLLLGECFNLVSMVSVLETQEKSLQCNLVQLRSQEQQQPQPR